MQFDKILAAYKAKSRLWNPTLNKFAEGESLSVTLSVIRHLFVQLGSAGAHAFALLAVRLRGRKRAMVG